MLSRIGRYEVLAELGRGGFGHVYRCLDPVLGTQVAIKILVSDGDARMLARFRNEAATSRKLTHPNIVTIYDFGDQDGQPYIVMELLEGQDLQVAIEARVPLSQLEKVEIMNQIAAGLGHAHSNGILHRDIKPANVMLLRDGSVKIMDFGIALITRSNSTRMTPQGSMIGTLRYLAPEQFREDKPDSRSDIFAYGLVSYELLGGTHPFNASDPASLMYAILHTDPVPIGEVAPECGGALQAIVERLLQKDPDLRYQSLEDVQLDLGTVLSELREERANVLIEEARSASSSGDLERARELTREVLALVPGHRTARMFREQLQVELRRRANRPRLDELVKQGRRALTNGNPGEAAKKFESALALEPTDSGLQDLLREARAENERRREASQSLARAETAFKAGDFAGAALMAAEALQLAPHLAGAQTLKDRAEAVLAEEQRKIRLAEQVAKTEELLDAHAWDIAEILLAELEEEYPREPVVEGLNRKLTEGRRKDRAARELAAGLAEAGKQADAHNWKSAVSRLEQLTQAFPESAEAQTRLDEARAKLDAERRSEFVKAKLAEAEALEASQQLDEAVRVLDAALERDPADPVLLQKRQAAARRQTIGRALAGAEELRKRGKFTEAIQQLDAALQSVGPEKTLVEARESTVRNRDTAELTRRANDLLKRGELEAATDLLGNPPKPLRDDPGIRKLRQEVEAKLRAKEDDEAKQLCQRAKDLLSSDARKALETLRAAPARLRARPDVGALIKDAERAALAQEDARRKEAERQAQMAAIRDLAAKQLFDQAAAAGRDALKAHPGDQEVDKLLQEVRSQQKEYEERKRKDARRALTAEVAALLAQHRFEQAERAVERDLATHRDDLEITNLLVDVRERRRKWETEQAAIRAAQEEKKRNEARAALRKSVKELTAQLRFPEAESAIEAALAALPGDLEIVKLQSDVLAQRRKWEAAQREQKRNDTLQALATQVETLTAKQRFAEAEKAIQDALVALPGDAEILKLQANVRERRRRWEAEQAAARAAQARRVLTVQVNEMVANRQFKKAERAVQDTLREQPGEPELTALLADVQNRHRLWDEEHAAAEAAQQAKLRAEARKAAIDRIRDLAARRRFDEAERAVEQAAAAYPGDAEISQLNFEVRGQHRQWEAEQAAARAAQELERRKETRRVVAARVQDLVAAERFDEAGRVLSQALAEDPESTELSEVRDNLSELHRQWSAKRAENEVREALVRIRKSLAEQPSQAVTELEALARQYAGREEIQALLAGARAAELRAEEEAQSRRAAEAVRESASLRAQNPRRALKQLQRLPPSIQSRPEVVAAIAECRQLATDAAPPVWRKPAFIGSAGLVAAAAISVWLLLHRSGAPTAVETLPVEIVTDPAGATVTAGSWTCVTPNCTLHLNPGSYEVMAKRDGYEPARQTVTIAAGMRPELVRLMLKPVIVAPPITPGAVSGTLTVRAGLPDALVYIDNTPAGRTGASGDFSTKLAAASHNVRVEKLGFETPAGKRVAIAGNKSSLVSFTLAPQSARLELRGAPAGVEIRASGTLLGRTNGGVFSAAVPPGAKTLRFTLGSGSNEVAQVFDPGRTATLDWSGVAPVAAAPKPPAVTKESSPKPAPDPAEQAWESVRAATDSAALQAFVQRFPNSPHAAEAQTRIESIEWSRAGTGDASALRAYLSRFPNGPHAREAAAHLDDIAWNAVDRNNLAALRDFAAQNPNSAHISDARSAISQLEKRAQDLADKAKSASQQAADQQAIRAALNEFNAAFQHRNPRELRQIWSNPMKELVDAAGAGTAVTLEPAGAAAIKGDTATVVCTYSITVRNQVSTARVRVSLSRQGNRWVIDGRFEKP